MLETFQVCYHGTVDIKGLMIRNHGIDLSIPVPGTDFGQGFYLTNNREQVEDWARNKARDANDRNDWINAKPVVLRYRLDIKRLSKLVGKTFSEANLEWGNFILNNRLQSHMYYDLPYDYAAGPVADGYMRTLMNALKMNLITTEEFINEIAPKGSMTAYNQLSVHSVGAVNCLIVEEVEYIEEV
ncbi:hypothetical protein SLU01_01400 [Sporosarcina luteola]|uniref:DUF3990 domain-containing protein n=1 Tax=Sporosarcina luteola TaxID=582850 RepID=A0A511Z2Z8_9BACL|nr:DUF3990 domain-containing protein [Sporosarcina luteola]GEN81828.1 hypothetical protein SLU01_01400 [Sporosarcina luteola]